MKKISQKSLRLILILLLLFFAAIAIEVVMIARQAHSVSADRAFYDQMEVYFDQFYIPSNPAYATALGIHDYDNQMPSWSRSEINNQITELRQYEKIFSNINPKYLTPTAKQDLEIILSHIHSQLLTLHDIRPWQKDPDFYTSTLTYGAFVLISRDFDTPTKRLKDLIAREQKMLSILKEAQQNLANPPKIYTEIALEQLPGIISFFEKDIPEAFKQIRDKKLLNQFYQSNTAVINALRTYQHWLQQTLLPQSNGDFRLGEEIYRKKLLYDEMVDTPLDELLAMNVANMKANQKAMIATAKMIAPNKNPQVVLDDIHHNYPKPDDLLATFSGEFSDLIRFIKQKRIVTIPSDIRPIMEETPPFLRAITFASMDTPGPFEKKATEAYFNVTLPKPSWDAKKISEFMTQFNYAAIASIAAHETYPGHYVQLLWINKLSNKLRKILWAATNVEGWAHYCEQMILDEGFGQHGYGGKTKIDAAKLRIGQLQEALLRNARFTVGIKLHTGQMTFDEAVNYFVEEAQQSRQVGVVETKRATQDPTYLYYTLGKLQILQLREDVKREQGPAFSLFDFHNSFMRQGAPPIKIVRQALLKGASVEGA